MATGVPAVACARLLTSMGSAFTALSVVAYLLPPRCAMLADIFIHGQAPPQPVDLLILSSALDPWASLPLSKALAQDRGFEDVVHIFVCFAWVLRKQICHYLQQPRCANHRATLRKDQPLEAEPEAALGATVSSPRAIRRNTSNPFLVHIAPSP